MLTIDRNESLNNQDSEESTKVSSGHWLYHSTQISSRSLVALKSIENHGSHNLCTLYAHEEPSTVHHATRVFSLACSFAVLSTSTGCQFSIRFQTGCILCAWFDSDHLRIIHGIWFSFIWCAAWLLVSLASVSIVCIKLFTAEYSAWAPWFSIAGTTCGSSGPPEFCHMICKHLTYTEWNPGIAATGSFNQTITFIVIL